MLIHDKILYQACQECVADAGKEDDKLVVRLYNYMYKNYDLKHKSWNYQMIDNLINVWTQQERITYKECITDNVISICAFMGPEDNHKLIGSSTCSDCCDKEGRWYFNRLYVITEYRGNHYGSVLLDKMLECVKDKGITLIMDINPYGDMNYEQLEEFYLRHGFQKISDEYDYYIYK